MIGDGRDKLRIATLASFFSAVSVDELAVVVSVDDREHRLGFCGAIREGWDRLRALPDWDYVFHLEEDWRFDRPLSLARMIDVLDSDSLLAQVALRRHAVNPEERKAGGVVEMWPDEYVEKTLIDEGWASDYLEHGLYFTTNPCVYRRDIVEHFDWPKGPACEAAFTTAVRDLGGRFALWGSRAGGPWITHTGTIRTGKGY